MLTYENLKLTNDGHCFIHTHICTLIEQICSFHFSISSKAATLFSNKWPCNVIEKLFYQRCVATVVGWLLLRMILVGKWGSEVLGVSIILYAMYYVFKINRSMVYLWMYSSEINGIYKTWKHLTNNRYLYCNCRVNYSPNPFSLSVSFAQCDNPQIRYKTFWKRTRGCYIAFMHSLRGSHFRLL